MISRKTRVDTPHIVQIASYGGPYAGSFVPMLSAAARAATRRGYRTTICFSPLARNRPWLTELDGLAEIRYLEATGWAAGAAELQSILRERAGPAVLHSHFGRYDIAAALAGSRRRRTATVLHLHSSIGRRRRLRSRVLGAVLGRLVDRVICVSPTIRDAATAWGFPERNLCVMPNAIDTGRFDQITPDERARSRSRLELDPEAQVVLQFAWNWELKGGDRLLATAGVLETMSNLRLLTVVGDGSGDAWAADIARHPNVTALAPRDDVKELYAAADVFLNCSRSEGMPYAVLEALSRGLMVAATDLPVQHQLLDGLPGGRVTSPASTQIALGLRELLAFDADQRAEHAAAARARVVNVYGLDSWSEKLADLYGQLIRKAGGRA